MKLPEKLNVKVKTNKPLTRLYYQDGYVLEVAAPPMKGEANKEIIKYFKKNYKKDIKIKGLTSNKKTIIFL